MATEEVDLVVVVVIVIAVVTVVVVVAIVVVSGVWRLVSSLLVARVVLCLWPMARQTRSQLGRCEMERKTRTAKRKNVSSDFDECFFFFPPILLLFFLSPPFAGEEVFFFYIFSPYFPSCSCPSCTLYISSWLIVLLFVAGNATYKSPCRSVRPLVGPSVGRSVPLNVFVVFELFEGRIARV